MDMASPVHGINTGRISPRRSQGASRLPVASGRGASASPGKLGERYPSFQPSTGSQPAQGSRLSRIPTAATPKHSSIVPTSSPASRSALGCATSRLATITAKGVESFRSPSHLGLQASISRNPGNDTPDDEAPRHNEEAPYAVDMGSGPGSEKPLPRPPSGARYSQRPTFMPGFSDARGTTSENSVSEGREVNGNWSANSSATSLHREHESGEELEHSSTPKAKENGIPSATPNTIVGHSTIQTTTDFDNAPRSSINTDSTSFPESPLRIFQEPILYAETIKSSTSIRKSYNPNLTMSPEETNEADYSNTSNTPSVTPKARPTKSDPFRERLQSISPGTAPQTPLGIGVIGFPYDFNEGDIDHSPTPAYHAGRKAGTPVPPSPSIEDHEVEPPPRTVKRKSRIPRISSPKLPLNGGINKEGAEASQKVQETSPAHASAIPLPLRLRSSHNTSNGPADIPSAVNEYKESEDLSTPHIGSEVTDCTGEIEVGEARTVAATKVSKGKEECTLEDPAERTSGNIKNLPGGVKLKQLSIAGRSDGPSLRIDPDAERIIMGTGEAEKDKKISKRRSGAIRNIRRSTDSLLSSYRASKRSRKSSTGNVTEVSKQTETQFQPRTFLPVKNLDIVKESPTSVRRIDSQKLSIRTVSETPKENASPCSNKNGPRPSAGLSSPNGNITTQHGSPYGEFKKGELSTRRRETHTLTDRINVNTPAKYTPPIPATPGERAAHAQIPTSGRCGQIPVRQANHASPRTARRQPNERMTFERMGFNNAPSAATPYASNYALRTVRSETGNMTPKEHFTATTRKSRLPSGVPKTKTRGVFQGFRGLFMKNKPSGSKATSDTAIGNVNGSSNRHGIIGSSPGPSHSPSKRPNPPESNVLPTTQPPSNVQDPNLHQTHSSPQIDDSPAMQDISSITNLTMEVLAVARRESEVSKKQKLISMGQILIATAAACHDAEAAMLRTLQGFKDAEVACAKAKENALKMAQVVRELASEEIPQSSH